jgi:hypothetical protein
MLAAYGFKEAQNFFEQEGVFVADPVKVFREPLI